MVFRVIRAYRGLGFRVSIGPPKKAHKQTY